MSLVVLRVLELALYACNVALLLEIFLDSILKFLRSGVIYAIVLYTRTSELVIAQNGIHFY